MKSVSKLKKRKSVIKLLIGNLNKFESHISVMDEELVISF